MGHIVSAIAPAVGAAVTATATVWVLRHYALMDVGPTVPRVLLIGISGLAAIMLAVLVWPETRQELLAELRRLKWHRRMA